MDFNLPQFSQTEDLCEVNLAEMDKFCLCLGLPEKALDRISIVLKFQLYSTYLNYKIFGNVHNIVREINALEFDRGSITKRESKFKNGAAKGLWKKHYFDGTLACFAKNMFAECGDKLEKLEPLLQRKFAHEKSGYFPQELSSKIARMISDKAYLSRARRGALTGQYIVFSNSNGLRNFICLARHDELHEALSKMIEAGLSSLKSVRTHYYELPN